MSSAFALATILEIVQNHLGWPLMWRTRRWAISHILRGVQLDGDVSVEGPLYLENHGHIRFGSGVILRSSWHRPIALSVMSSEATLTIGQGAFLNWGVDIGLACKVVIGANALIGDDVVIYDSDWHTIDGTDQDVPKAPTYIGRGVWLGARSMVLRGVSIGDNSVIAASSVVTYSLPDHVLAAGAPAKVIRKIQRSR